MQPPTTTWLSSKYVWHLRGGEVRLGPAAIAIKDGIVTQVLSDETIISAQKKTTYEKGGAWQDLGDLLITPSLVNAHTHLAMACFRGLTIEDATTGNVVEDLFFAVEETMTPEDIAAFAKVGAYESLLAGVGLVWEHYYGGEALAEAITQTSLCAVLAPTLQDLDGPGKERWEEGLALTEALDTPGWQARGIWSALGPHATDTVSATLWEKIRTLANTRNLPIHSHAAQSIEEFERSITRHGKSPVAWLDSLGLFGEDGAPSTLLVHAIFVSDHDLDLISGAPAKVTLGFCPYSQLVFGFPADVARWQAYSIPWYVATDAAASNDSMNLQKELRYIAGLRTMEASFHPDYRQFAKSGALADAKTANAARQKIYRAREGFAQDAFLLSHVFDIPGDLHPAFTAGTIAPGALANLAVWDTTHPSMWPGLRPMRTLAMGDTTDALWNVMSRGVWVGEGGNYHRSLTDSQEFIDAKNTASQRLQALLKRL